MVGAVALSRLLLLLLSLVLMFRLLLKALRMRFLGDKREPPYDCLLGYIPASDRATCTAVAGTDATATATSVRAAAAAALPASVGT